MASSHSPTVRLETRLTSLFLNMTCSILCSWLVVLEIRDDVHKARHAGASAGGCPFSPGRVGVLALDSAESARERVGQSTGKEGERLST